jgi:hypothetical protein
MFDLVTNADQKTKVVSGIAVHRAAALVEAPLQLPVFISTLSCGVEATAFLLLLKISIFYPLLPIVTREWPEMTSQGEKPKKVKTRKGNQIEKSKHSVQTRIHREDTLGLLRRGRGCYGTRR